MPGERDADRVGAIVGHARVLLGEGCGEQISALEQLLWQPDSYLFRACLGRVRHRRALTLGYWTVNIAPWTIPFTKVAIDRWYHLMYTCLMSHDVASLAVTAGSELSLGKAATDSGSASVCLPSWLRLGGLARQKRAERRLEPTARP